MGAIGRMKTKGLNLIFALLLAILLVSPTEVRAVEQGEGIDALLLIDISGSMRDSDSSRNAIEATKMFIDMLETHNSRVGIIGFNDQLTGVVDITEIESIEDKERLKQVVDGFNYSGWTDIGLPLKEAVSIMSRNMRRTNSPMVLLMTDGNIALGEDNTERTVEESYEDVVDAITASGRDLPIYTIGLNYDGSVDRTLLRTISESTGGRSYIITEATDLPQIFNEIFADHVRSQLIEVASFKAGKDYTDVDIEIDSDFVAVANIIMLSENGIQDARVFSPSGEEVVFGQETITFSSSRKYSIVKFLFPERGTWLLQVKGVSGDLVRVNLIYQYNISVDIEVSQDEAVGRLFDPTLPVTINGRLLVNGEPADDEALYLATASNAIVSDMDGKLLAKVPLTATRDGLVGSFTQESGEPAAVYIETAADGFTKQSRDVVVQFEQPKPTPAAPPVEPEPLPEPVVDRRDFVAYGAVAAVIILLIMLVLIALMRKRKPKFFDGFLEVRLMNDDGIYTSVEVPALHTYIGTIDLNRFLMENMPAKVKVELESLPFSVRSIFLTPSSEGGILLENKSSAMAMGEAGAVIGKRFVWKSDQQITISAAGDSPAKLELTYRVDDLI